jgi:hypothetical protein
MPDFDFTAGNVRMKVTGVRELVAKARKAGMDLSELNSLMHTLGQIVVQTAHPPVGPTGRLARSVRAGAARTKAVVRAGGAAVPYAGPIHYGWPARNIQPQQFLLKALAQARPAVLAELDHEVGRIIKQNHL